MTQTVRKHIGDYRQSRMATQAIFPPVTDTDIQRAATGMIRIHRGEAIPACAHQISRMRMRRDEPGAEVWQRILAAVRHAQTLAAVPRSAGRLAAGPGSRA